MAHAVASSVQQWIFIPPVHFSRRKVQRGIIICPVENGAMEGIGMAAGAEVVLTEEPIMRSEYMVELIATSFDSKG
jgi:hypothetical protein